MGGPSWLSSIRLSMQSTQLSSNAILLCFKLVNEDIYFQYPSIVISVDLWLDTDYPSVTQLPSNSGFRVWGSFNELTFICRSYPLVRSVSSYWFGAYDLCDSNNWTQIAKQEVSMVDTGATISWQAIPIPSRSSSTRSIIVKSGPFANAKLELSLTFPEIPSSFTGYEKLVINGTLTVSSLTYKLLTVIDNDIFTLSIILDWRTAYSSSSSISFSLLPAAFNIYTIQHQFAFYAVNEYGDVSSPQFLYLSGIPIGDKDEDRQDDDWKDDDVKNDDVKDESSQVLRSPSIEVVDATDVGWIGVVIGCTVFGFVAGNVIAIFWYQKSISSP
jgi:hypothetical protein